MSSVLTNTEKGYEYEKKIRDIHVEAGYDVECVEGEFFTEYLLNGHSISEVTLPHGCKMSKGESSAGHN